MARVGSLADLFWWSLLMTAWSAVVVLELGLNAYWVGERMLCLGRWVMS